MALIELSQPYIEIDDIKDISDSQVLIQWKVNGCYTINSAYILLNDQQLNQLNSTHGYCNYKIHGNETQTIFTTIVDKDSDIRLMAVVDQDFGTSANGREVDPREYANRPQLHLSKMRTEDQYEVSHKGKTIKAGKVINLDSQDSKYSQISDIGSKVVGIRKLQMSGQRSDTQSSYTAQLNAVGSEVTGEIFLRKIDNGTY